jgi:protein-arginine kinase activator protein McsA
MACANCGKRSPAIRYSRPGVGRGSRVIGQRRTFTLYAFLQSRGKKPTITSPTIKLEICDDCAKGFRDGKAPKRKFANSFSAAVRRTLDVGYRKNAAQVLEPLELLEVSPEGFDLAVCPRCKRDLIAKLLSGVLKCVRCGHEWGNPKLVLDVKQRASGERDE